MTAVGAVTAWLSCSASVKSSTARPRMVTETGSRNSVCISAIRAGLMEQLSIADGGGQLERRLELTAGWREAGLAVAVVLDDNSRSEV